MCSRHDDIIVRRPKQLHKMTTMRRPKQPNNRNMEHNTTIIDSYTYYNANERRPHEGSSSIHRDDGIVELTRFTAMSARTTTIGRGVAAPFKWRSSRRHRFMPTSFQLCLISLVWSHCTNTACSSTPQETDATIAKYNYQMHQPVLEESFHSLSKANICENAEAAAMIAASKILMGCAAYHKEEEIFQQQYQEHLPDQKGLITTIQLSPDRGDESPTPKLLPIVEDLEEEESSSNKDQSMVGDGIRSEASSSELFKFIDSDGDGILEAPELADFVRESIVETQFDDSRVDDEVTRVMNKIDRNDEEGLERSDVFEYWMQLESLLTVDEVAEWVVHAVQMPDSMGEIFRENVVTGYDFPELVENDGESLSSELNIEKASFKKKIVRHIYARLLGIGSTPTPPTNLRHELESCSTVSFSWDRSTANGFPVHSYRVQRRTVDLKRTDSGRLVDSIHMAETGNTSEKARITNSPSKGGKSDWETIYIGGDNEFVDGKLKPEKNHIYRIQAWNSVGRSEPWVTVDISRSLKKKKCFDKVRVSSTGSPRDPLMSNDIEYEKSWFSAFVGGVYFMGQLLMTSANGLFTIFALVSAAVRFKRATANTTTSTNAEPLFPWLWHGINSFSARVLGVEVVPSNMLGENSSLKRAQSTHDESVKAVGLRGYKRDAPPRMTRTPPLTSRKNLRSSYAQEGRSKSFSDISQLDKDGDELRKPNNNKIRKNVSFRDIPHFVTNPLDLMKDNVVHNGGTQICRIVQAEQSRESSITSDESENLQYQDEDDDSICNTCRKRYKFGKRWKHHCARCLSTFCHKHGRTTHNGLTSCKVPGNCVCNICLELEEFNNRDQFLEETPTNLTNAKKTWLGRKRSTVESS